VEVQLDAIDDFLSSVKSEKEECENNANVCAVCVALPVSAMDATCLR